jgi:hypothetical protein
MPRCQDFASFYRQPSRLKGRSLHFPPILNKIPSIQNLNETTGAIIKFRGKVS